MSDGLTTADYLRLLSSYVVDGRADASDSHYLEEAAAELDRLHEAMSEPGLQSRPDGYRVDDCRREELLRGWVAYYLTQNQEMGRFLAKETLVEIGAEFWNDPKGDRNETS